MSQNAGTLNPSRGNRRFVLLAIVLGLMGAGLVYVATSRSPAAAPESVAVPPVPVVVAKAEVPARTPLTQEMLDVKLVPPDAVSPTAFRSVDAAVGNVTRYPLTIGEQVLSNNVVNLTGHLGRSLSFVIPEGKRGFAITTSDVENAGGLVLPGDYVDILVLHDFDFAPGGDLANKQTEAAYLVQTLMQNVEVLAVAQTVVDVVEVPAKLEKPAADATPADAANPDTANADATDAEGSTQRVRNSEAPPQAGATTITVAVSPEEAELLYLAEANGRIRLSVRAFGDDKVEPVDYQLKTELIPSDAPNPFRADH